MQLKDLADNFAGIDQVYGIQFLKDVLATVGSIRLTDTQKKLMSISKQVQAWAQLQYRPKPNQDVMRKLDKLQSQVEQHEAELL
jgi:hypothetical protein